MDLVVFLVLMAVVIFVFKDFKSFVYFVAIVDIFLRIIDFIKLNINVPELYQFFNNYFPTSVLSILNRYSSGVLNTVLAWFYVICFVLFEFYLIKSFIKRK